MNTFVFTCGDINGIGPEICIKSFNKLYDNQKNRIVFICPGNVFESAISLVKPSFNFQLVKKLPAKFDKEQIIVLDIGKFDQRYGVPTKESGFASFLSIVQAFKIISRMPNSAVITAPISKTAFKLAGKNYPGHTELFAELCRSKNYLMIFLSNNLICGLATIHVPVKKISGMITKQSLRNSLKILYNSLEKDLGIENPSLAVLGLNPHAGEAANIGKEEINFIAPAIKSMKNRSIQGPFVPDAFFGMQRHKEFNAVLGMYHDQVLIPFKLLNFNTGVNYTAGLKIIRTSPDHGTGYDIAGRGTANSESMLEAVRWAEIIIENRAKKKNES